MSTLSMIKRRIAGLKYAIGLTVLNLILFWRNGAFNQYLCNSAVIIFLLGILAPVLISDMERILYSMIRVTRIIITLLLISILHLIIFPLIRLSGLIFKKHFTFPAINSQSESYYSEKGNDWRDNLKEPF